ncbi:hypothetical protein ABT247_28800 [Kitasatospora sp. NPDC001539]|uniref:hypothetical protein n=1 Tax=Kitasatospora sp. NPDC001539 TaxID=3154384 RepID=UPI0033213712
MKPVQRIAAAASVLALALGGAVALAPAAAATPQSCFYYLLENSPDVDHEIAEDACKAGADGSKQSFEECYRLLRSDYVPAEFARNACRKAAME